jgi:electron transport complex protein RnfG
MKLPETPRLALTLTVAGLLSGLAIVSAYQLTLPRIEANNARALRLAVFQVLPGSERLQPLAYRGDDLVPATDAAAGEPLIYGGYTSGGEFVGYAIPAAGAGFQDTIRLLYGFEPKARRIVGMQVLESRETPGLGDRIYKDEHFLGEFRDLAVEPQVVAIKGHGEAPNEVDAITGATISSKAVVAIVNAGNAEWLSKLPEPGREPPLAEAAAGEVGAETPKGGPVPGGRN